MRKIRILVCLFFLVSCVCYGVHTVKDYVTKDKNPPVIFMEEEELHVPQGATDEDLLAGVTAKDEEDGDLTDRIQIASISKFQGAGERTIRYIVFDDANQLGTAERTLVYEDYDPPRIYLKEPLRFTPSEYEEKLKNLNISASDSIDGDLTANIRTSYGSDMYNITPGNYPMTFQVNNSAGDTCVVPVELTIVDSSAEVGKYYPLLTDYIVYTKVGSELQLSSYLAGIESSSEILIFGQEGTSENINASRVSIQSGVDYATPGVYTVNYSYTTNNGVSAVTVLYVVVEG